MLQDQHGHKISYLRISITDRCNLRCVYCMPPDGVPKRPHREIMRFEEIAEMVRITARFGVNSVRLTGGEPLVRPDLPVLVRMISDIPGIDDISMTTNAVLLEKLAGPLADAGLRRVNISLDTLQPEKYTKITRGGSLEKVWKGIEAAEKHGLTPIKINNVAIRGLNEDEIIDLAKLSMENPWSVRFIELMPINNQIPWGEGFPSPKDAFISVQELKEILEPLGLEPVEKSSGSGPAREYRLDGALGKVGFISPISDHFCGSCNRLRLTADGNLRPCLLSDIEIPVLRALRAGEPIEPILQKVMALKPLGHELDKNNLPEERTMKEIGG
ncbi:MAG: GTP 3',8-cyclase MoaA [Anaerolineaceae bacterium]|nr:GTP 3',8-cyclase MoaA [Anaerolineaceae bacterium]